MEKKQRIVGFDTAEETHEGVLLDLEGAEAYHFSCLNRKESIEEALAKVLMLLEDDEELVVTLEAPRAHGRLVFEIAKGFGLTIRQVGTLALNRFRESEGCGRKDDHWDAYLAARMVFVGSKACRIVADPRPEERVLCRLSRARSRLQHRRVSLLAQLRSILLELAPIVLDRSWEGPKPSSVSLRKILKRWPAFEGIGRARKSTLKVIFRSCKYNEKNAEVKAEAVKKLAGEIVIPSPEREAIATEIEVIIQELELLEKAIADLERQLKKLVLQHEIGRKLLEMPGIGVVTAAVLIGEYLPVARNSSEASSANYSGVTPLGRKSGKSLNSAHLNRGSNKRILHVLYCSSQQAISRSALDRAYYDKKRKDYQGHPKPHTAALLALARQRHKVIYKIVTGEVRYDKEVLISSHLEREKTKRVEAA